MFLKIKKILSIIALSVFLVCLTKTQLTFGAELIKLNDINFYTYNTGESIGVFTGVGKEPPSIFNRTQDPNITRLPGVYAYENGESIEAVVLDDGAGHKLEIHMTEKGQDVTRIKDPSNGKVYLLEDGADGVFINADATLSAFLNSLKTKTGYTGDLYAEFVKRKNIFHNNQLIKKLQSAPSNHIAKCDANSRYGGEVKEAFDNGDLTAEEEFAMRKALSGEGPWTRDLAIKFRGVIYTYLGADVNAPQTQANSLDFFGNLYKLPGVLWDTFNGGLDAYLSYEDAQKTIECAFITASTQDEKDREIALLKRINETGETINDITGDELDNHANMGGGIAAGNGIGSGTQVASEVLGEVNQARASEAREEIDECLVWTGVFRFQFNFSACIATILYYILTILSFILGIVGFFFNSVFEITVVNMKANVSNLNIIAAGWATIRDFANILFIFILLYLAISTILQLDEHGVKHSLSRLIVGAVLINFSLFFVKIPIDISNILAIEIYNKIKPDSGGLGDTIMAMFSPQQVFNNAQLDPEKITEDVSINGTQPSQWNLNKNPLTTFVMAIIIIFISILIFTAVCIIFIKRFITLVMLMIFSPLAFAGMAVPSHSAEHQISDFWDTLFKESFYAPIFMFLLYLAIRTGQAINNTSLVGESTDWNWTDLIPVSNITSYVVVMGMIVFALTVSETIGVKGASGAIKAFDGMRGSITGMAQRHTVGRFAHTLVNKHDGVIGFSDTLAKWATGVDSKGNKLRGGIIGQWAQKNLARGVISGASKLGKEFDEKEVGKDLHAFEARIEEAHGDEKEIAKILNEAGQRGVSSSVLQAGDNLFHHLSTKTKAGVKLYMEEVAKESAREKYQMKKDKKGNNVEDIADYEKRVGMNKLSGESVEAFQERVIAEKAKDNKAMERYFTGHGGGGRLEQPEITEVDRLVKGALPFWDKKFKEALDYENGDMDAQQRVDNMERVLERFQSPAQMLSALKSLNVQERTMFEGNSDDAKKLRTKLTQILRDKFQTNAFYEDAAKDPLFGKDMKEAIAAPVWQTANTFALYTKIIKEGAANVDEEAIKEFESNLVNVKILKQDLDEYQKTMSTLNTEKAAAGNDQIKINEIKTRTQEALLRLTEAYRVKKAGVETALAHFATQTNATRTQVKSTEIAEDVDRVQKIIGKSLKDMIEKVDIAPKKTEDTTLPEGTKPEMGDSDDDDDKEN